MAEEQKPVAAVQADAPAVVAPVVSEAPAATTETPAAVATEEAKPEVPPKVAEEAPKEEVKPIYDGTLTYNPTGNIFTSLFAKKPYHFFFGEEPVATDKLAHLLKPGKTDLKETVAWASQTGKGLLFFSKSADQTTSPKGAIALADVEDIKVVGHDITFKLHGNKHTLVADTAAALKGWQLALEEKVTEAKNLKEEISAKDGFKETLEKLAKPAVPAAVIAKTETTPKKSTDSKSVERAARSSEATDKARPAKERSQSRSKALFAKLSGKKEAAKDEPKAEEAKESTEVPATDAAPVEAAEAPETPAVVAVSEEAKAAETEEAKPEDLKKQGRRSSKFFDRFRGVTPAEKKSEEVSSPTEAVAKTEAAEPATETPAIIEPAKATEPVIDVPAATEEVATADGETKTTEEPTSPTTAAKEEKRRSSFFGLSGIAGTIRKHSRSEEKKPKITKEETKTVKEAEAEEPAAVEEIKPEVPAKQTEAETAPVAETAEPAVTKEPEVKKEKTPLKENQFVVGIHRRLSKALRKEPKEKKATLTSEKVEEKPTEETKAEEKATEVAPEAVEPKKETSAAPAVIGDVVPEAVHTGAPQASATVSAKA